MVRSCASGPRSTLAVPSPATIRLRPVDARPWTIIDARPRRSALRALRVSDDVSK
jgi:hypothetical protein